MYTQYDDNSTKKESVMGEIDCDNQNDSVLPKFLGNFGSLNGTGIVCDVRQVA